MAGLSPLINPTFRRLFAAQALALLGMGLTTVGLALLVYELDPAQAGLVLGAALGLKMVVKVIVAPIAGAYANRVPRRALLGSLDLFRAALIALYPFIDSAWQVYVLVAVIAAAEGAFNPIFQATVPDVLKDEEQYTKALSYSRIAFDLENVASPLLAALFLGFATFDLLFELNALAFLLSAALLFAGRLPTPEDDDGGVVPPPFQKVTQGLRLYFANRELRGVFVLYFAIATGSATAIVATVLYVKDALGLADTQVALAMTGFGAGSIFAALLLPRILKRATDLSVMLGGGVIVGVALMLSAGAPPLPHFVLLWALMGFGTALSMTPVGRVITRASDSTHRAELFAAQYALSHCSWLVLYPLVGALVGAFSFTASFVMLAALALIATIATYFIWRG
jgi:MFS family permease